jgi:hypothetical protein
MQRLGIALFKQKAKALTDFVLTQSMMNNSEASCDLSEFGDEICLKTVIPECFLSESGSGLAWIPA